MYTIHGEVIAPLNNAIMYLSLVYFVSLWLEPFDNKCVLVLYFHNFIFPLMLGIQSWMYTLHGEVIAPISSIIMYSSLVYSVSL